MRMASTVLVALLLTGCGKNIQIPKGMRDLMPKATFAGFKVDSFDFQRADTVFTFDVENPYPVGLELQTLNWTLGIAEHPFLDGAKDKGIDIDPGATSKVKIPVGVVFADVFALAADLEGKDELPWTLKGDMAFNTPIGPISLPFDQAGMMPAITAPRIKLDGLRMGKLDLAKGTVGLELDLALESDQEKPVLFETFAYAISLAGNKVLDGKADVAPIENGKGTLTVPLDLKLVELGESVVKTLTNKGELNVGIDTDAMVATPLGPIPLKVSKTKKLQLK